MKKKKEKVKKRKCRERGDWILWFNNIDIVSLFILIFVNMNNLENNTYCLSTVSSGKWKSKYNKSIN